MGLTVGLAKGEEHVLRSLDVLVLASPGLQHTRLERAAEGEGERPRVRLRVHRLDVQRRLFLTLPAREEGHAGHGGWHSALEAFDRHLRDRLRRLLREVRTRNHHRWLEER